MFWTPFSTRWHTGRELEKSWTGVSRYQALTERTLAPVRLSLRRAKKYLWDWKLGRHRIQNLSGDAGTVTSEKPSSNFSALMWFTLTERNFSTACKTRCNRNFPKFLKHPGKFSLITWQLPVRSLVTTLVWRYKGRMRTKAVCRHHSVPWACKYSQAVDVRHFNPFNRRSPLIFPYSSPCIPHVAVRENLFTHYDIFVSGWKVGWNVCIRSLLFEYKKTSTNTVLNFYFCLL